MSYCLTSSRLLSLGPCSKDPKPIVLNLPVVEMVAKSAMFASRFATAAYPPLLSISDIRNSLNHTSPLMGCAPFLFFIPIIKVLTKPKFGLPLIPRVNLLSEEPISSSSSSTNRIPLASGADKFGLLDNANTLRAVKYLKGKLISLSNNQTSSANLAV